MVRALVLERQKRSTAGTRMSTLVGQAAKDDEEFWSHSTWAEEKDDASEDGSFHESDEESDAKVDVFDSDFDESEDEGEGGDGGGEGGEEALLKEERREKRAVSKRKRMDIEFHATKLVSRDIRLQQKRNAAQRKKQQAAMGGLSEEGIDSRSVQQENVSLEKKASTRNKSLKYSVSELVGKRSLRTSTINNSIATSAAELSRQQSQSTTGKARHKRKYTQEELLMEAVSQTEPENQRWLLNRKRMQMEEHLYAESIQKLSQLYGGGNKKVISKFHSRRGCFNTITFPEMDHVPEIFTMVQKTQDQHDQMMEQIQRENTCVITGKKARYRDPKTKLGYHDLAAFRELRRRLEAGEVLDRRSEIMATCNGVKKMKTTMELQSNQKIPPDEQEVMNDDMNQSVQTMTPGGSVENTEIISNNVAQLPTKIVAEKVQSNNSVQQHVLDVIHPVKDETAELSKNMCQQSLTMCTKHVQDKEQNGHETKSLHTFGKCPYSGHDIAGLLHDKPKIPVKNDGDGFVEQVPCQNENNSNTLILPSENSAIEKEAIGSQNHENLVVSMNDIEIHNSCQEEIKKDSNIEHFAFASKCTQDPTYNLDNHQLKSCGKPVSAKITSHSNKAQMPFEQPQHG
jgi:YL1 nuclear protein C-terminal domain./YL1 nuclear protein.